MGEIVPPSLAQFQHYFDADRVEWAQVNPGWGVVIEAHDLQTKASASLGFQIVDKAEREDGPFDVWVELDGTRYHFIEDSDVRKSLVLPKGTLMKAGVSCEHFPVTTAYMTYFGGIAVGRDFSFNEVQVPDGTIIGGVLVAGVHAVHTYLPEGAYFPPDSYQPYRDAIGRAKTAESAEYDAWVTKLDAEIAKCLDEYFTESDERSAVQEIISTFYPEGRYKLLVLIEYAHEDGVLEKFLSVLKDALDEEFSYMHPAYRGIDSLPASQRGWAKMVHDLGLRNPRPTKG